MSTISRELASLGNQTEERHVRHRLHHLAEDVADLETRYLAVQEQLTASKAQIETLSGPVERIRAAVTPEALYECMSWLMARYVSKHLLGILDTPNPEKV